MRNSLLKDPDFLETLGLITPLPSTFQERIEKELQAQYFKKKHLLLRAGETARKIYFIQEGFIRSYFIDTHGKEHTSWFMGKGQLIISNYSFLTQKPSYEYIEVLQDSKLQSLNWHQLNAYYAEFKEGNLIGRIISQNQYLRSEESAFMLRNSSISERYSLLKEKYPDIDQLTTQNHIASFLGIRPITCFPPRASSSEDRT
ncbi:MAG: Crp/Fnr family transcriptional regulator [Chryseobacterium sp.]|nr:MAG: Crp/Fnr family transcriptional regulator [Chryseobacterium sp.]